MKNRENKTISENEAIERIKYHMYTAEQAVGGMRMEDLEMAIKALEEVQQYRAIGTTLLTSHVTLHPILQSSFSIFPMR